MAIAAMSSSAGAATTTGYSTNANGGFISLSLLNLIGLTGAGSSASATATGNAAGATNSGSDTASGTGLCATLSESSTTCPTTTDATSADVINTTANATANSAGPLSDTPAPNCLVPPVSLVLITLEAACGRASATEDATGDPTASGEGDLANVTVSLGAAVPGLGNLLGNGTLCGSSSSPAASTSSTGLVSGLLSTVNGILSTVNLPILSATSNDPLSSVCGILSGLTGELPIVGSLLSNASASTTLLSITVGDSTSTVTNSTASNGDQLVTTTATTEGVDINLLGMLDIKVLPNTASVTLDTTTGLVQPPTAVTGVLSVSTGASAPTVLGLPDLSSLLGNLLNSLGVSGLINPQLTTVAESTTAVTNGGTTGTANSADLKLDLLGGLVVVNLGNASVTSSSTTPTSSPAVVTSPAVLPTAPVVTAPAAAVVPNVTTVHTGEFWSGPLPIFLMSGMGVAGMFLIGRRRVFSVARSVLSLRRR